tara:strand:+ start:1357 stop:2526 length:1170 start_codon:yes stop_codon:yes gene_type:complete
VLVFKDTTKETHRREIKKLEASHLSVLEVISKQMKESTFKYDTMEKKYMSNIASLQVDLCTARSKHKLEINGLEDQHSSLLKEASERIHNATHQATSSTLELEASIREEILETHQETMDEMEEQITKQRHRINQDDEKITQLELALKKSPGKKNGARGALSFSSSSSSMEMTEMRHALKKTEQCMMDLSASLNEYSLDNEQEQNSVLDAAAKAVGNHNVKEKIHFVEKLQKDRRELKLQNRHLTAEVARLQIVQAKSGFKKFRQTLNGLGGSGKGRSGLKSGGSGKKSGGSGKKSGGSGSGKKSGGSGSGKKKKASLQPQGTRKSPAAAAAKLRSSPRLNKRFNSGSPKNRPLTIVTENKENSGLNSPRSRLRESRLRVSQLSSPRSVV